MKILIVGLGVIGGGYAMALKEAGYKEVYGVDINTDTLKRAKEMAIIKEGFINEDEIISKADFLPAISPAFGFFPAGSQSSWPYPIFFPSGKPAVFSAPASPVCLPLRKYPPPAGIVKKPNRSSHEARRFGSVPPVFPDSSHSFRYNLRWSARSDPEYVLPSD